MRLKILFVSCLLTLIGLVLVSNSTAAQTIPTNCGLLSATAATVAQNALPWYCPINNFITAQWLSSAPLVFIVVLISFLIAGAIFMIGAALRNERIRNFGIGELYEAVASALIAAIFMYLCAVLFGYTPGIFVGAINPYATAFNLINSTMTSAQNLYTSLFNPFMTDSAMLSSRIALDTTAFGTSGFIPTTINGAINIVVTALTSLFKPALELFFIAPATVIENLLLEGMLALSAEYYLLMFFALAAIPAFLIPGIIFRSIFPTRALGSVMMALAIAFYLVMPMLFAVAFYFTSPLMISNMQAYIASINRFGAGSGAATNALSAASPIVVTLGSVSYGMAGFWLLMLFYPGVIMAITYVFVVEVSNAFGGIAPSISSRLRRFV